MESSDDKAAHSSKSEKLPLKTELRNKFQELFLSKYRMVEAEEGKPVKVKRGQEFLKAIPLDN